MSRRGYIEEKVGFLTSFKPQSNEFREELDWIARSGLSWAPMDVNPNSSLKSVYIRVVNYHHPQGRGKALRQESRWHAIPAIDLQAQTAAALEAEERSAYLPINELPSLPRVFGDMPLQIPYNSASVALLPRIYVVGGYRGGIAADFYSYDITSPWRGWEKRPNMRFARDVQSAAIFALDGKIYVLGGMEINDRGGLLPMGEVYDPRFDSWESLPITGQADVCHGRLSRGRHALFIDLKTNQKHILLESIVQGALTYDVSGGSFTLHGCKFKRDWNQHLTQKYAVVDGILYCLRENFAIYGYDLANGELSLSKHPVKGLRFGTTLPFDPNDPDTADLSSTYDIHLRDAGNGRLCILWAFSVLTWTGGKSADQLLVRCSVVKIKKVASPDCSGDRLLEASVESHKLYIVPGSILEDCIVL